MRFVFGISLILGIGGASVDAQTENFESIRSWRFVDIRQDSPDRPTIRHYNIFTEINLIRNNSVGSLQLVTPRGKKYFPYKISAKRWQDWVDQDTNVQEHLKKLPGGTYTILCKGRSLDGKKIHFALPGRLLNPNLPYLGNRSFLLLTRKQFKASLDQNLVIRTLKMKGSPYVSVAQPLKNRDRVMVQIYEKFKNGDSRYVFSAFPKIDSNGLAKITIPGGTLKAKRNYDLLLQTDHEGTANPARTSEGAIPNTVGGISFYALSFQTS